MSNNETNETDLDAPIGGSNDAIDEGDMRAGPDLAKRRKQLCAKRGIILVKATNLTIKSKDSEGNAIESGPIFTFTLEGRDDVSKGCEIEGTIFLNQKPFREDDDFTGSKLMRTYLAAAQSGNHPSHQAAIDWANGIDLNASTGRQLRDWICGGSEFFVSIYPKVAGKGQYAKGVSAVSKGITHFQVQDLKRDGADLTSDVEDEFKLYLAGKMTGTALESKMKAKREANKAGGGQSKSTSNGAKQTAGRPVDSATAKRFDDAVG